MSAAVVALPGDGVGPEVTTQALRVLRAAGARGGLQLEVTEHAMGGAAIDSLGAPLPRATLEACRAADAVLLGAVGGPRWDHLRGQDRCEAGLLALRSELGVFANLRPVRVHPRLAARGPVRADLVQGTDLVIVRELTGGAYFGSPKGREGAGASERAVDTISYTRGEVDRVVRVAFQLARQRRGALTSVDKANVLASSQLWRDVVTEVANNFPDVHLEHALVDSFAMRLVQSPRDVDVVVTENLFGDILSDEAAVLPGSLGLLPSASLGEAGSPGLYEPIHGSAPDLAGTGRANPLGAILSVALMLRHSLGREDLAVAVEAGVDAVIDAQLLTADLGGSASTTEVADAVLARIGAVHPAPAPA